MSIHPFREHIPSGVDLLQNYNNYFKHADNILKKLFVSAFYECIFSEPPTQSTANKPKVYNPFYVSLKTFLLLISAFRWSRTATYEGTTKELRRNYLSTSNHKIYTIIKILYLFQFYTKIPFRRFYRGENIDILRQIGPKKIIHFFHKLFGSLKN